MKLGQLLEGVTVTKLFQTMYGRKVVTQDIEVSRIQYDSRRVEPNDCFVAIRGTGTDGHRFIQSAINRGARVVVLQSEAALPDSLSMHAGVVKLVVPDSRKALAVMSANYFGHPSRQLTMVGVTGTNGKTTTTHIVKSILEAAGRQVGLIGTIEYKVGDTVIPATHTTPESLELNELLARMVQSGCTSISMEVSSHALHQSRVYGLEYDVAVFTNLTQDHLDYHGSMDEYFRAKRLLFEGLTADACAVTNLDDQWGSKMTIPGGTRRLTYSITAPADVRATDVELSMQGTSFTANFRGRQMAISSPLVGRFNVYNILAAFTAGLALDIPHKTIATGIGNVRSLQGRFERIASPKGWTAIVDYAHTPDALEKCLRAIHDILPKSNRGRVITVFGAGGDRDRTKRPVMGKVVSSLSDLSIVTSDNPRTEDPQRIVDEIVRGIANGAEAIQVLDRRAAIKKALGLAGRGDVVLIAGKGHEDYQVIGKEKIHFSDREVVEELINT
jgi:UDP-N-acetylmuramoyl-L-alanyl-D-glutamate--2,6-diaminopimelate ligase